MGQLHRFDDAASATIVTTPAYWLQGERACAATALLEQDPLDLARIADACGMLDAFRAAFRRYVGVAPSVYRSGFGQVA